MKVSMLSDIISQYDTGRGIFKKLFTKRHPSIRAAIRIRNDALKNAAEDLSLKQNIALLECFIAYPVATDDEAFTVFLGCVTWAERDCLNTVINRNDPNSIEVALCKLREKNLFSQNRVVRNHKTPIILVTILILLDKKRLLTPKNITAVLAYPHLNKIANTLSNLYIQNHLTKELLKAILNHETPEQIVNALNTLQHNELLQENQTIVGRTTNLTRLPDVYIQLYQANLLTPENQEAVIDHVNPDWLTIAFIRLQEANLLLSYRKLVITSESPDQLALALISLHQAGLIKDLNPVEIAQQYSSPDFANACIQLHQAQLWELDNHEPLKYRKDPIRLAQAFVKLHSANILLENRAAVIAHKNPVSLATALFQLHLANILAENRAIAITNDRPENLAGGIIKLHHAGILTTINREAMIEYAIAEYRDPSALADAFIALHKAGILTHENRNLVIRSMWHTKFLIQLHEENLHTPALRDAVLAAPSHPQDLVNAFIHLQKANRLTKWNQTAVSAHQSSSQLAIALIQLDIANMLTPKTRLAVQSHAFPAQITSALTSLQTAGIDVEALPDCFFQHVVNSNFPLESATVLIFFHRHHIEIDEEKEKIIQFGEIATYFNYVYSNLTQALSSRALELAYSVAQTLYQTMHTIQNKKDILIIVNKHHYFMKWKSPINVISYAMEDYPCFANTPFIFRAYRGSFKLSANHYPVHDPATINIMMALWIEGMEPTLFFAYLKELIKYTGRENINSQKAFFYQVIKTRAERCCSKIAFNSLLDELETLGLLSSSRNNKINPYQFSVEEEKILRAIYDSEAHQKRLPGLLAQSASLEYEAACLAEDAVKQLQLENGDEAVPFVQVPLIFSFFVTQETRITALRYQSNLLSHESQMPEQ